MVHLLAGLGHNTGFRIGLVATAFGFGFRHGIDWDHIAALTDITGSQETSRQSMLFATLYALGHALVVFALGLGAIVLSTSLPKSADGVMEHFVGATLILLGIYVFYSVVRHGRNFRMRSRWMLVFSGLRRGVRWFRRGPPEPAVVAHDHEHDAGEVHDEDPTDALHFVGVGGGSTAALTDSHRHTHAHRHRHIGSMPDDPFLSYGRLTSFGIGMIHGVGAETPTQVLIFVAAAGAGGRGSGVALLVCFVAGLLCSNTVVALASTYGFVGATRNWKLYLTVSLLTATFSLVVGTMFLVGKSTQLPALFGG